MSAQLPLSFDPLPFFLDALQRTARVAALRAETPTPATWATPNEATPLGDTLTLRRFGAPSGARLPALIVTPQVNHSYIADFTPEQSLVRTLRAAGVPQVGVTDWQDPPRDRPYTIADSIADVERAVGALGGRAHVIGLCQGGWQAAMFAALRPAAAASLTAAAAPIDFHAGSTLLHAFTLGLPMTFFETLVALNGGVAPGALLARGFDALKPFERGFYNAARLWFDAKDEQAVGRYRQLRNWYRLNKDVAGALYLEAVRDLFKANGLVRGTVHVAGERVDLGAIRCPVVAVAGRRDHISPAEQVFALCTAATGAPTRRSELIDAGHIGVFMGREALATFWPKLAASFC